MKHHHLLLSAACSLLLAGFLHGERTVLNINEDWDFHLSAEGAEHRQVDLPHTWNARDAFDHLDGPAHVTIMDYYFRGKGTYEKQLHIPADYADQRVEVFFEAAFQRARGWLNGHYLGEHKGGYSAFSFDLTPAMKAGEKNVLKVEVDNSFHYDIPPHRADYTMYGGLYRDVFLVATDPVHLDALYVDTPEVSREGARVGIRTEIRYPDGLEDEATVEGVILDPENNELVRSDVTVQLDGTGLQEIELPAAEVVEPALWSPSHPHLYTARVHLMHEDRRVDTLRSDFGLRWFHFDPQKGFFLNGEFTKIKGVNRHQDRHGYGIALSNEQHWEDMRLIKEMGANFVRLAHYPQDPAVLEACDRLGLLVWEEIPVVTGVGRETFAETSRQMLREMITQHYNHPSIIIWGLMNETIRRQLDKDLHWTVDLCADLNRLAKELDSIRLTAQAQFAARGTAIFEHSDIRGWNRYFGWYYDDFAGFAEWLDEEHRNNPDGVIFISEYGAGSERGYHLETPSQSDFTETWATAFHKAHWKAIQERDWVGGSAVWNMFDFASEEKGGNIPGINQKGLADFDRKPKDAFYFYQSQWADKPMVYIVSQTWINRTGREDEVKTLEVFSNCETVELFLNGDSLGKIERGEGWHEWLWKTRLPEGINELRAVGTSGQTVVEDRLTINYTVNLIEQEEDPE